MEHERPLRLECSEWRAMVGRRGWKGAEVRSIQFSKGGGEPPVVLSSEYYFKQEWKES